MHELSIAMSIVELAQEESSGAAAAITAVHLKLGPCPGVVKEALLSSYEMACEEPSRRSRLIVEDVPGRGLLPELPGADGPRATLQWFYCSECGTPLSEVVQGKELRSGRTGDQE